MQILGLPFLVRVGSECEAGGFSVWFARPSWCFVRRCSRWEGETSGLYFRYHLHGNEVLVNDTYNPQWNNLQYTQELGLTIYPPYPEASGYAMSADLAAFLSNVGMGVLENLQWKAWSIEDSALGTILAGLSFDMIQMPVKSVSMSESSGKKSISGASRDSWVSIPFSNP